MEIIEGFEAAKSRLSRQATTELYPTSLIMKPKPKDIPNEADKAEPEVKKIIDEVRRRGDAALFEYSLKLDKADLSSLEVSKKRITDAYNAVEPKLVSAIKLAAERVRAFHQLQKESIWHEVFGDECEQLIRPLERVGLYVPGGTVPLPSTVLMTAIPARVAGVGEIIMVTPPRVEGAAVPPSILTAADIAGVDRVFSVGGAQAIAALAFGTESIPKVDKICGPGNIFVTLAKRLVYGAVDIDGLQGPSEVLIIADETASVVYCAADLLAQAEHDPLASAVLVATSRQVADEVDREIKRQIKDLPRQSIATESLVNRGVIAVVASVDEGIELANLYAPEHLCLMVRDAYTYIDKIHSAGCIFVGESSAVALGDYVAGPSHVLPTGGTARFGSPLNIIDFIKLTDVVNIDQNDLKKLGQAAITLARAEGLEAHAHALEKRLDAI